VGKEAAGNEEKRVRQSVSHAHPLDRRGSGEFPAGRLIERWMRQSNQRGSVLFLEVR